MQQKEEHQVSRAESSLRNFAMQKSIFVCWFDWPHAWLNGPCNCYFKKAQEDGYQIVRRCKAQLQNNFIKLSRRYQGRRWQTWKKIGQKRSLVPKFLVHVVNFRNFFVFIEWSWTTNWVHNKIRFLFIITADSKLYGTSNVIKKLWEWSHSD